LCKYVQFYEAQAVSHFGLYGFIWERNEDSNFRSAKKKKARKKSKLIVHPPKTYIRSDSGRHINIAPMRAGGDPVVSATRNPAKLPSSQVQFESLWLNL